MRRTFLYILIPLILLLGTAYFFLFKPKAEVNVSEYIAETDLVVFHIPHVFHRVKEDQNKSVYQHLLQLEGLDGLNELITENVGQFDAEYLTDLTLVLTSEYEFLLVLDESNSSFSDKFWESLVIEDGLGVINTSHAKWYFRKHEDFVFCSNSEELVGRGSTKDSWDLSQANWKHSFVRFNKSLTAKGSSIPETDFMVNWSNERVNLSGYKKTTTVSEITGQLSVPFNLEYDLALDLNQLDLLNLSNATDYFANIKIPDFTDQLEPSEFNGSSLARVDFKSSKENHSNVFLVKSKNAGHIAEALFNVKTLSVTKTENAEILDSWFPEYASGINKEFILIHNDLLILGEKESVKEYESLLRKNAVWAYSLDRMKWIENELIPSADFHIASSDFFVSSVVSDTAVAGYLTRNASVISAVPYVVLQRSDEGNGLFTGMSLVLDENATQGYNYTEGIATEASLLEVKKIASFKSDLVSKPFPVKSHVDKSLRFVVLDNQNEIYLMNQNGKEEWSFKLDGTLLSGVEEVDLFKNRKFQYVFATDKKVYCVDRLGRMVENFPIKLSEDKKISSFKLIDYDKSRNYRMAITSGQEIWLYGIDGKSLEGWSPKKMESSISGEIEHVRLNTKDFLIVQEENNTVSMLHRNGDMYDGFPINLKGELLSEAINIQANKTELGSFVSFVTKKGEVIKYDFTGSKIGKEGLTKTGSFDSLFVQNKRNDYRYFVYYEDKLEVYDEKYVIKFTSGLFRNVSAIQSYSLSSLDVYAVFHSGGMTLVTEEGKILMDNVETGQPITLYYSRAEKRGYFYYSSGKDLKKTSFLL